MLQPVRFAAICTGFVILTAAAYFVTHEQWKLFSGKGFVTFYDEQGRSLMQGKWDVPPSALGAEAFVVDGKSYGYFAFAPALPRVILNYFWPSHFGQWSRLSILIGMASLIAAFFSFRALLDSPILFEPLVLLILLGGTTAMFLCASDLIYHEAIMWGAALALWANIWSGWYLKTGRFRFLLLGALSGFGAFFARVPSGLAALTCAALILVALIVQELSARKVDVSKLDVFGLKIFTKWCGATQPRRRTAHAAFLLFYFAATAIVFLEINHAKFGAYFEGMPIRYNLIYPPKRLDHIQGRLFHPEYLPVIAANYFDPAHIRLTPRFPYIGLTDVAYWHDTFDLVEPYASFPAAMPAALFLAGAGIWFLFRPGSARFQWCAPMLLAGLPSAAVLLSFAFITYRYEHDLFPVLFPAAMLGAAWVTQIQKLRLRRLTVAALVLAAGWSVWANVCFLHELQVRSFWAN
jgi:hypothetical protein